METLNSLLNDDDIVSFVCLYLKQGFLLGIFRTWGQQKITMSLICLLLQKHVPIPLSCIRTFVDFLVHDNIELRKVCRRIQIII